MAGLALATLLTGCGSDDDGDTAGTTGSTKVSVGLLHINADVGMYLAQERGYFKEQGLEVTFQKFTSGSDMIPLIATNKLDVGTGAPSVGLYNSMRQGLELKVVASNSVTIAPKFGGAGLLIRKDLWDSGAIKTIDDLRGKTIALNNIGNTSSAYVVRGLKTVGLTKDDVKFQEVPPNNTISALQNKAIDATFTFDPLRGSIVNQGLAVYMPGMDTVSLAPNEPTNLEFTSPGFTGTETAKKFEVAHIKGLRDYYDAFIVGKTDKAPIIEIMSKYTGISADAYAKMELSGVDPNGDIKVEALKRLQDEWLANGFQKEPADIDKHIDTTALDYAIEELGRVETSGQS